MKKLDLGQTVGILANIGVIAGIVFLAVELAQNNELLAAQARLAQAEKLERTFNNMIENPEFAEALSKGRTGEVRSPREELQVRAFYARQFQSWQWMYRENQAGALDRFSIEGWRNVVRGRGSMYPPSASGSESVLLPGWLESWESSRVVLDPEFVQFMDENVFDH